jgi:hypothetical protein
MGANQEKIKAEHRLWRTQKRTRLRIGDLE